MGQIKQYIEDYDKMKAKERKKELEETKVGKRAEVRIRCNETGEQFIPDCDFKKYTEGKSKLESPHTGKEFKTTPIKTDNEEDMKIALLGTEDEGLGDKLDDGDFKDSSIGQESWNATMLTITMAFNAWLLFTWIMDWDFSAHLWESRIFLVSLTATVTLTMALFYVERKHQENDNWYFLDGMCVGHSEDNKVHYVIATSDDNYIDHLKAWYGKLDDTVHQSLENLGKKYQDKIDELKDEKRELEVELENTKERNAEKTAKKYEENRVNNTYREDKRRKAIIKAVAMTAIVATTIFISILYIMGWTP